MARSNAGREVAERVTDTTENAGGTVRASIRELTEKVGKIDRVDSVDRALGTLDDSVEVLDLYSGLRLKLDVISNERRMNLLMMILGHPSHLPSQYELSVALGVTPQSLTQSTLPPLLDADVVQELSVRNPDNPDEKRYPTKFYTLTETGAKLLDRLGFLDLVGVQRALYDALDADGKAKRHEEADRPPLPDGVERRIDDATRRTTVDADDGHPAGDDDPLGLLDVEEDADTGPGDVSTLFED
jgi:DNA-binding MarR family transcriptional regulator